jgi:hypothetical protein
MSYKCPHCQKEFTAWYWGVSGRAGGAGTIKKPGLARANFERHKRACYKKRNENLEASSEVTEMPMDKLRQTQPMKGRPATKIEIEAAGAICRLQDELHEAREIIRALLGAPPPRTWKKWPNIHKKATEFLKR